MKTTNQKYRRSHWWKFTDWSNVAMIAVLVVFVGFMLFGIGWVITHPGTDDKADSIKEADSVITALEEFNKNCDSTLALQNQSGTTKSDPAVFDSTIGGTRVVIKTNRPIRVVVK